MRVRVASWLLILLVAVALAPRTASAFPVTITYSISGGTASGHLNGAVSPGGTVTVGHPYAYTLRSAPNHSEWYLRSVQFQTAGGGIFSYHPNPLILNGNPNADSGANAVITASRDFFRAMSSLAHWTFAKTGTFRASINRVTVSATGPIRSNGYINLRGNVYTYLTYYSYPRFNHALAIGQEIGRVPEPSSFAQVAVGVFGLAALAAGARRRRRRS